MKTQLPLVCNRSGPSAAFWPFLLRRSGCFAPFWPFCAVQVLLCRSGLLHRSNPSAPFESFCAVLALLRRSSPSAPFKSFCAIQVLLRRSGRHHDAISHQEIQHDHQRPYCQLAFTYITSARETARRIIPPNSNEKGKDGERRFKKEDQQRKGARAHHVPTKAQQGGQPPPLGVTLNKPRGWAPRRGIGDQKKATFAVE